MIVELAGETAITVLDDVIIQWDELLSRLPQAEDLYWWAMTVVDKPESEQPAFDIEDFLKHLTRLPGIYKMLNDKDTIVYIGKAKISRTESPAILEKVRHRLSSKWWLLK